MSAGPIKQWRDAHLPPKTIPTTDRLHARTDNPRRAYCGTTDAPKFAHDLRTVTCPNCAAAIRADKETTP